MHTPQKWVNIHPGPGDPGPGWVRALPTPDPYGPRVGRAGGQDTLAIYGYIASISCPITGNTLTRFVMTVKAQNDIRPHGNTYPQNATPIITSIISIPLTNDYPRLGSVTYYAMCCLPVQPHRVLAVGVCSVPCPTA